MALKLASSVAFLAFSRTSFALQGSASGSQLGKVGADEQQVLADSHHGAAEAEASQPLGEGHLAQELDSDALLGKVFDATHLSLRFEPMGSNVGDKEIMELSYHNITGRIAKLTQSPTHWRKYWGSQHCKEAKQKDRQSDYFIWCDDGAPGIYSPKHKFGYMKTPKVASTAFFAYFRNQFEDAVEIAARDFPDDAYVFTFARRPFEHKLAAFAEVDLKQAFNMKYGHAQGTKFQDVPRSVDGGRKRFRAFLDDIRQRRFHSFDARSPQHAGSQISGPLCAHKMDFIGHMENVAADWAEIQKRAQLPLGLRTKVLPVVHKAPRTVYQEDESVPLDKHIRKTICEMYKSEHICLGYSSSGGFCKHSH